MILKKHSLKKVLISSIMILTSAFLFSATAKYQDETFSLIVNYTETVTPGDAIFVRLNIQPSGELKKHKSEIATHSLLQLIKDKKEIDKSSFYSISKSKKSNNIEILAGIPLSSWLKNANYSIKVTFNLSKNKFKEFELPLTFTEKTFFEETIELDAKNTEIKTDNSPKRASQIDKLNSI